ncbi:hypothetical protein [Nonomuraea glycinis]|uniref:hypothetical protein n=1 Tax=Nonomuraea glycinis TaxID=2047744 RepID=UPI002E14AC31|nr:hypothetical protein OHA68_00565 [Nonomuraea glycinis]
MPESVKMVMMRANQQAEARNELAVAIRELTIPDGPAIRQAFVEPYSDSEGEPILRALVVLDAPDDDGWSARFTHDLRKRANRLAVEHGFDEYVYVTLLSVEDFAARDEPEDTSGAPDTSALTEAIHEPHRSS